MSDLSPSGRVVRELVARADARRRSRRVVVDLARLAPVGAALVLVISVAGRLAGWPRFLPLVLLAALAVALAAFWVVVRSARGTTDTIAAEVDADAGLRGELRSAHWFGKAKELDDWATYHVERAVERAQAVDWAALYPPVRASRQWIVTGLLAVAAAVVTVSLPARDRASAAMVDALGAETVGDLPADLRRKLEALIASMEEGKASADETKATLADLKALMAQMDPALQKKLAEMLEKQAIAQDADKRPIDRDAAEKGENAENAAAGMPEDVRWALDDLASRLASADQNRQTNPDNPSASSETGEKGAGSAQAAEAAAAEAMMQMVKEAASDPGDGKMMAGGGGAMGGDSRSGAAGNQGAETGAADALLLAKALRMELVEAAADIQGENVDKEDIRRKTEQGKSTLGFTRVTPPAAFEPSRADAPPPVPEARRPMLLNYFIRHR